MIDPSQTETSVLQSLPRIEQSPQCNSCHDLNRANNLPSAKERNISLITKIGHRQVQKGKIKFTEKGSGAANMKLNFEEIEERSWTLQSSVTVMDGESAHDLTESSLGEFIRFRVEGSGEMVKGDV